MISCSGIHADDRNSFVGHMSILQPSPIAPHMPTTDGRGASEVISRTRRMRLRLTLDREDVHKDFVKNSVEARGDACGDVSQKHISHRRLRLGLLRVCIAVLLLVTLSLGMKMMVAFTTRPIYVPFDAHPDSTCARPAQFSLQSDHRTHSHSGELYLQAARASFEFLPDPETLMIEGLGTHGTIRLMLDDHANTEDHAFQQHITVDVTAFSDDWLKFEQTAVLCQTLPYMTEAGSMLEGVLISARDVNKWSNDRTAFDITVWFPSPMLTSSPLVLPSISATLFGFEIHVHDMGDRVAFDSVFLRSMDKPIRVDSLNANRATIQNWNGIVTGSITSENLIDLYAHNGAVTVNVSLVADRSSVGSSYRTSPVTPTLSVKTVHGAIKADVNLLARSTSTGAVTRPSYRTLIHSSEAPLAVTYPIAPEYYNLSLFASNSHAPTTLRLPESFIGSLALRSHIPSRPPTVRFDQDPDKHGRSLHVTSTSDNVMTALVLPGSLDSQSARGLVDVEAIDSNLDLLL